MKKILIVMVMVIGSLNAKNIDCNSKLVERNLSKITDVNQVIQIKNIEIKNNISRCEVNYKDGSQKDIIVINEYESLFIEYNYNYLEKI